MGYPSIFEPTVTEQLVERVNRLCPETQPEWGKMNAGQMLAHCNVVYNQTFGDQSGRPNRLVRWIMAKLLKPTVVGPKPYTKNMRTAPAFLITDERDFAREQASLIGHLREVVNQGAGKFEGRQSFSFGPLTAEEWSVLFYKHLDHHLRQFGV